jgi:hypothetical protein
MPFRVPMGKPIGYQIGRGDATCIMLLSIHIFCFSEKILSIHKSCNPVKKISLQRNNKTYQSCQSTFFALAKKILSIYKYCNPVKKISLQRNSKTYQK